MKANRKIIENNKGVTPALTMLLVIPVILMLISAVALWSQNFLGRIKDTQEKFNELRDDISDLDFASVLNGSLLVYADDFEDSQQNNPQWQTKSGNGASKLEISPNSYYSGKKSGYLNLGNNNGYSSIKKTFSDKCYGNISIKFAFTTDVNENEKVISIYQDNEQNNATIKIIKIGPNQYQIKYFTPAGEQTLPNSLYLYSDENDLCWHTFELIINFDSNNLNYKNLTIDGTKYDSIDGDKLQNQDTSSNYNTITVKYTSKKTGAGIADSYIDSFIFLNLEPFKNLGINIV